MAVDILDNGWNISKQGEEIITENNTKKDKSSLLQNALNSDLKEIGSPVLSKIITKGNVSRVVLQIQKIRNIAAPKANENSQVAPRMLKLVLTDGETYIQAVEISPIPFLNYNKIPPGSKLLIYSAKISSGYLLLDSNNCSLLGGQVPALYEKWQLAKSVQHYNRQNTSSDGPPAWVNFGSKIQSLTQDKNFKSLDNKNSEMKENSKFEMQRQDAIAEASSGAVKKVFGQAKLSVQQNFRKNESFNKDKKFQKEKNSSLKEMEEKPQKPCEKVSLFDFLEDKLVNADEINDNSIQNERIKLKVNSTNSTNYYQNNRNKNIYTPKSTSNKAEYNQGILYNKFKKEERHQALQYKNESYNDFNNKFKNEEKHQKPQQNTQLHNNDLSNRFKKEERYPKPQYKPEYHNEFENIFKSEEKYQKTQQKSGGRNDMNELSNSLGNMAINSQFASRSLRQHLNLGGGSQKKNNLENASGVVWKVGGECMAKYWEDGKYYNAIITAVTDRTCVVQFKGYGNIEEVLKTDCLPKERYNNTASSSYINSNRKFKKV